MKNAALSRPNSLPQKQENHQDHAALVGQIILQRVAVHQRNMLPLALDADVKEASSRYGRLKVNSWTITHNP